MSKPIPDYVNRIKAMTKCERIVINHEVKPQIVRYHANNVARGAYTVEPFGHGVMVTMRGLNPTKVAKKAAKQDKRRFN
jgi:hypothetical protein